MYKKMQSSSIIRYIVILSHIIPLCPAASTKIPPLEILTLFDQSYGVFDTLTNVAQNLTEIVKAVNDLEDASLAIATFTDKPVPPLGYNSSRYSDFCFSLKAAFGEEDLESALDNVTQSGGYDFPEGQAEALLRGLLSPAVNWSSESKKVVVLTTNSIPHHPSDLQGTGKKGVTKKNLTAKDLSKDGNELCATNEYPSDKYLGEIVKKENATVVFMLAPANYLCSNGSLCAVPEMIELANKTGDERYKDPTVGMNVYYNDWVQKMGIEDLSVIKMIGNGFENFTATFTEVIQMLKKNEGQPTDKPTEATALPTTSTLTTTMTTTTSTTTTTTTTKNSEKLTTSRPPGTTQQPAGSELGTILTAGSYTTNASSTGEMYTTTLLDTTPIVESTDHTSMDNTISDYSTTLVQKTTDEPTFSTVITTAVPTTMATSIIVTSFPDITTIIPSTSSTSPPTTGLTTSTTGPDTTGPHATSSQTETTTAGTDTLVQSSATAEVPLVPSTGENLNSCGEGNEANCGGYVERIAVRVRVDM